MWRIIIAALIFVAPIAQAQTIHVPEGYVLQELRPTGGQIAKPANWQYHDFAGSNGWTWIIAASDPTKWYDIGWRTQLLIGVESGTKRPRADFVRNFINQKRTTGQVLRDCPQSDQGDFFLICLETIETLKTPSGERRFHILYSVFWGKQMDMVYVTTSGAPEEDWETARPAFEVMRNFIIIGADFANKGTSGKQ
ncbi:hypothetical protein [Ferrovibrio terrae]|uniref:hypothetical protein n=1 Tax=Ferrovibrio terrae TaxID=2594003 RepID=UPI0031379EC6